MPASPIERCVGLAAVASLMLAMPTQVVAAPPEQPSSEDVPQPEPSSQPDDQAAPEPEPELDQPAPEPEPEELVPEPEVTGVEHSDVPSGGGIAGAIVDPNDPNASRAQSDLEGEQLDAVAGVPDRLPRLQAAGWWTTFTAVALATSGGIVAGVAELRQDQAERMAYNFELQTGRTSLYGPVASEYEQLLDEGHTYQWVARGLIIAGGAALVASIGLFAADAVQRRKAARSTSARLQLQPGPGGFTLRF